MRPVQIASVGRVAIRLSAVRSHFGQVVWAVRQFRGRGRLYAQIRVNRRLTLPDLPRRRARPGQIWAVSVVRDEADIIGQSIAHLFAQGVDQVLVADNGSQDGTRQLLETLAQQDARVHLAVDDEPAHLQGQKITRLARAAWRSGADWVLPFDADEFFFARGESVAEFLRHQPADIVHVAMHHVVPAVADAIGPDSTVWFDCHDSFPGKVVFRSHPLAVVAQGNHSVARVGRATTGLFMVHAQYRGPHQVARKIRQGAAAEALAAQAVALRTGDHWEAGAALTDEEVQDVWRALSTGLPEPRLKYLAIGPVIEVQPFRWQTWDPRGEVATARRSHTQ